MICIKEYYDDEIKWLNIFGLKPYYYKITRDGIIIIPSKDNMVRKQRRDIISQYIF